MSVRHIGLNRTAGATRLSGVTYAGLVLANNPAAFYRFGELSGTTFNDSSGNNHNGAYVNSPTLGVTGLVIRDGDPAASFASASSQYAEVSYNSWMAGWTQFTLMGWIKRAAAGVNQTIVARDISGANGPWRFRVNSSDKLDFFLAHPSWTTLTGVTSLAANTRYHVAAKYDGANMKIFVNGSADGTIAATGALNSTDSVTMRFGAYGSAFEYFNGVIDEFSVYTTALSDAAILSDYQAGA